MQKIIVVGAGIAGLTAAQTLTEKGHQVLVIDKGRGLGGRMSSKSIAEARFDYGAQYFSAKTPDFQQFVQENINSGIIKSWELDWLKYPRYIGASGMSAIPKNSAKNLDLKMGEKVISIQNNSGIAYVSTDLGHVYEADAVVLTSPVPQSLELLSTSNLLLSTQDQNVLANIQYDPCIALMVCLNRPIGISQSGGLVLNNEVIAWLADNQTKGISDKPSLTVHTSATFAKQYFDEPLPETTDRILAKLTNYIPADAIAEVKIHRWRYSLAAVRHEANFYKSTMDFPLYFAGDAFGIGNVEGAFLSGLAVGRAF